MIEYVYALHDFVAENEDEVSFHAGERIEVIEKDDGYGDGWWQVSFQILSKHGIVCCIAHCCSYTLTPITVFLLFFSSV